MGSSGPEPNHLLLNIAGGTKNQTQEELNQIIAASVSLDLKQGWRFSLLRQL